MNSLKKVGLLFLFALSIGNITFAQNIPSPMSPPRLVNDFTGSFFTQAEQAQLENKLRTYHDTTSTQIYVVVVNTLDGQDKSAYAALMGQQWNIGQKGKDNGILLLIKPKNEEGKGEVFIATGYGMEEKITDAMSRRIIEKQILPKFRENQFYAGVDNATTTIIQLSSGTYKADKKGEGEGGGLVGGLIFFGLLALMLFLGSKKGGGGKTFSSSGSGLPFWLMAGAAAGSFGNFRSGGGSFGGGGGGFSGGGGGSFGGGGAGGSW